MLSPFGEFYVEHINKLPLIQALRPFTHCFVLSLLKSFMSCDMKLLQSIHKRFFFKVSREVALQPKAGAWKVNCTPPPPTPPHPTTETVVSHKEN